MASWGKNLSTRTSSEVQSRDYRRDHEAALKHFGKCKVQISDAIQTAFPFLQLLRDNEFITNETYEDSQAQLRKDTSLPEVVYNILSKLEETFHLSLLRVLFSKVNMTKYPNLKRICTSFRDVIKDEKIFQEISGEEKKSSAIEKKPDQGMTPPESRLSEHLREAEQINAIKNNATSDNNDALESGQAVTSSDLLESSEKKDTHEVTHSGPQIAPDTPNPGNSASAQKAKRKRKCEELTIRSRGFHCDILPVTCGEMKGDLIKRKIERGGTVKSIRSDDGKWFTPMEFQVKEDDKKPKDWKLSINCGGKSLKLLMKMGFVPQPPTTQVRKKKPENSDICEVCQDGGNLFCCDTCQKSFHEQCHIPPVETQRSPWLCTFCLMEASSKSQECQKEYEALARKMGPEEQLKCELLLLKVYCHLEGSLLNKIPHDDYIEVASQCLKELRMLAHIKTKLKERGYPVVGAFVCEVLCVFQSDRQSTKGNDSDLTLEEFKKNFKEMFAIQETMKNSVLA